MTPFQRFEFVRQALAGSAGFADGSYLVKYPRETTTKYDRRREIAWYVNHILPACIRFAGYLAKRPPIRDIQNPLLGELEGDCDYRKNSLDVFWQSFMVEAKARGTMLLLVDSPQTIPVTQGAQREERAIPYLVPIFPEKVVNYQLTDDGRFDFVEIGESQLINGVQVITRVRWTTTGWEVRRGDQLVSSGEHNLGECPVLIFTESGDFPYVGSFEQIAHISKRLYNAQSELDELHRSQTFSILAYQIPPNTPTPFDAAAVAEGIGTHNMLVYHGEGPGFISPSSEPATSYQDRIAALEEKVRDIAMTVEEATAQESGVALTIRFQALNSALTSFARRMEDLERRVWSIAAKWLGVDDTTEIEWAKDYSISDPYRELEILSQMQSVGMPHPAVQQQMRTVVAAQFATIDQDVLDTILQSIDELQQEVQLNASTAPVDQKTGEPLSLVVNVDGKKAGKRVARRQPDGSLLLEDVS